MDAYLVLLILGFVGFLAMVAMGMGHAGGHAGHALGHGGHALGHGTVGHAAHSLPAHGAAPHGAAPNGGRGQPNQQTLAVPATTAHASEPSQNSVIRFIPSPIDFFSLALGAGAAGMIAKQLLMPEVVLWVAIAGALAFDFVVTRPMMSLFMRFASKESEGLEGQLAHPGEALCRFDAQGKGLVKLTLDGQISQLLAELDPDELAAGTEVHKGDEVLVIAVDAKAGKCRVSRQMTADDST